MRFTFSFSFKSFVAIVVILQVRFMSIAQVSDSVWIQDRNGCKVHNPNPIKDETISWSGPCLNGYATGTGTLVWYKKGKRNQEYSGDMVRGKPEGTGRYEYIGFNGRISSTYTGHFLQGKRSGFGLTIEFNEIGDTLSLYSGDFAENAMDGKGAWKEFDDVQGKVVITYRGEFSANLRCGYGEEVTGNVRYDGQWKDDQRSGAGKIYLDSMLIYEGQWNAGKFNGIGKRFFFDGSYYAGDLKDNSRHGVGKHYWSDGTRYIGEFKNDLYSGDGYFIKNGQVIKSGKWEKGIFILQVDSDLIANALFARYKDKLER